MAKQLILMRHAKSSWDDADLSDHDRPLNQRGHHDARRMGTYLRERDWLPEIVLTSTANRAKLTWEGVVESSGWEGATSETYQLYLAHPERIIQVIQRRGNGHDRVLVVGHNPGLQELVEAWTDHCGKFPTAAIAFLEFDIDHWHDLAIDRLPVNSEVRKPKQVTVS